MIRYGLTCDRGHGFDGWFRSSADFDGQSGRSLLDCPVCGPAKVAKALMAPAIATRRAKADPSSSEPVSVSQAEPPSEDVALVSDKEQALRAMLRDLRDHVAKTSENVGERFPEVARQIHAEEIEPKSIYGRATPDEAKALAEEGIELHPLPRFPEDGN